MVWKIQNDKCAHYLAKFFTVIPNLIAQYPHLRVMCDWQCHRKKEKKPGLNEGGSMDLSDHHLHLRRRMHNVKELQVGDGGWCLCQS